MSLFQKSVLNKYLQSLDNAEVEKAFQKFKSFYGDEKRIENIKLLKEENYQEGFLREIFVDVLDYTINPDKDYDLTTEFKNETDSKKADGAILLDSKAIGVIELKSTKTTDMESIIDQAFNYKNHQSGCKYVITSNFEKLRFYIDNATEYEEFYLFDMDSERFKIFYLLLSKEKLLNDIPAKIKKESQLHEEDISDKLYKDYTEFKYKIYRNLIKNNPQYDKLVLFKKSQKLLDRILFILFAEDSGLVPPNAISEIIKQWKTLIDLDEKKSLYSRFVKFFHHLNVGHKYSKFEVPAYNGGLFKEDEILDNVKIDDEVLLDDALKLSTYDYSTEVDVNILGHIFEHSISEIEEITAELEGEERDASKSKRKKEGVFYTPKYITKYIVENTVGELCEAKKKELHLDEIDEEILENSKTSKGKLTKKAETLFNNLKTYREYILSLKILDPACGSGAFLNQVLDFLIEEHKWIDEQRSRLLKESFTIVEYEKDILEHNLYGVDINEEAVEIAKLSLWLRTAKKGRKLSDLSGNIKCGNSLIDDPEVAGDKAFKWEEEFPQIMSSGGFDVVIGNPPYLNMTVNNTNNNWLRFYTEKYVSVKKSNSKNLFTLFIEKGIDLLKVDRFLSLIIPEGFLTTRSYNDCVEYANKKGSIISSVYFDEFVFQDAVTGSLIINFIKGKYTEESKKICYKDGQFIETPQSENNILIKVNLFPFKKLSDIGILFKGMVVKNRKEKLRKNYENNNNTPDKFLLGSNISRYLINSYYYCNYDELEIVGGTKVKVKYDVSPRILIRRTGDSLCCALLENKALTESTLYSLSLTDNKYDLLYVLGILNAKISTYVIRQEMITNKQAFPQILMTDLGNLQIAFADKSTQNKISDLVHQIISLQKDELSLSKNFISKILANFSVDKLSTKLTEFYNHDFKTFLEELKKKKVTLKLTEQDEWEEYFNEHKEKILELQSQINRTDREIDQLVYRLYGLTEEEIKIVEESVK